MNRIELSAIVCERGALRYTPAGLPALDLQLVHESSQAEADHAVQVKLNIKAVAIGAVAERLDKQPVGLNARFSGFLANMRQTRQLVLHIHDFQQNLF